MIRHTPRLNLAVLSLTAAAAVATLAGCGTSRSTASPPAAAAVHATSVRHALIPNNPPDPKEGSTAVPKSYTVQLGSNTPVPFGSEAGLAASSSPETITVRDAELGSQRQAYQEATLHIKGVAPTLTLTVQTTEGTTTHTYLLRGALIGSITTSAACSTCIPLSTFDILATSVQQAA